MKVARNSNEPIALLSPRKWAVGAAALLLSASLMAGCTAMPAGTTDTGTDAAGTTTPATDTGTAADATGTPGIEGSETVTDTEGTDGADMTGTPEAEEEGGAEGTPEGTGTPSS